MNRLHFALYKLFHYDFIKAQLQDAKIIEVKFVLDKKTISCHDLQ